jgi:uncharacterized protein (DUF697 family)
VLGIAVNPQRHLGDFSLNKLILAAACMASAFTALPVQAAKMLVTFSGTVMNGNDQFGRFGTPGQMLTGMTYVARYTIDTNAPTLFPVEDTANHSRIDSGTAYNLPYDQPSLLATLTINQHTLITGHYSATAQYGREIFGPSATQHSLVFNATNGSNGLGNILVWNSFGSAPSAHLTEEFDVSLGDGLGVQSYFNDNMNGVNTHAQLNVTHISAQALAVPEPASWALLIGGFGIVGAASRRRVVALIGSRIPDLPL